MGDPIPGTRVECGDYKMQIESLIRQVVKDTSSMANLKAIISDQSYKGSMIVNNISRVVPD